MVMNKEKLEFGIIQRACNNLSASRNVYYRAKKRIKKGEPLSFRQSELLKEIDRLKKEVYQP